MSDERGEFGLVSVDKWLVGIFLGLNFVRLMDNTSLPRYTCKNKIYKILGVMCLISAYLLAELAPLFNGFSAKILYLSASLVFVLVFYLNHFVENLILVLTYMTTSMCLGYIVNLVCTAIFKSDKISSDAFGFLTNAIMILVTYLVIEFILSNILDYKNYFFTNIEFCALFCFNVVGYVLFLGEMHMLSVWVSVLCVIAVLIMSALIKIVRQKEDKERLLIERNKFLEQQDKLVREKEEERYKSYQKSVELDQQVRRINHDLMHHFNYVLDCKNIDQIRGYINGLKGTVEKASNYFDTGSSILDLILEEKCKQAERAGLKFKVMGDFSDGLKLEPASVSIIFGNLLNNAIEGCSKVSKDQYRSIDVIFYQEPHKKFYLKISNTANIQDIKTENGKIKTSKTEDKEFHGIGLDSVRQEIEKYKGDLKISMDVDTFITEVIIPVS